MRTWTGSVYLATSEVGTPDRPFRSEWLYRLRFPGRSTDKYPYLICCNEDCNKYNSSKAHFLYLHTVQAQGGVELLLHTFTMSAPDGSEWSVARPCQCTLGEDDTVPSELEAGWATVTVRVFCVRNKCAVVARIGTQNFLRVD